MRGLDSRATALRFSLLASLGLVPIACGTTSHTTPGDDGGTESGGSNTTGGTENGGDCPMGQQCSVAGEDTADENVAGKDTGDGNENAGKLPSCTLPTLDTITGLTTCEEGYRFRGEAVTCDRRGDEVASGAAGGQGGAAGEAPPVQTPMCATACEGPHAFCNLVCGIPVIATCQIGCVSDDECADTELCLCDSLRGGACVPASCRSDADCEAGYHCALEDSCCGNGHFSCQKAEDECLSRDDCDGVMCESTLSQSDHRKCNPVTCGRPFLVDAVARVAPVVASSDWLVRAI
jgi:hypothetical protein